MTTAGLSALRSAAPYLRLFKGRTFVVKAGGGTFEDPTCARELVEQLGILHQLGIRVVLVHGGGGQSTALAEALGVETRFVAGRRVTDERALELVTMVLNGAVNTRILSLCRDLGVPAVGLSGIDAGLVRAERRAPVVVDGSEPLDYGYVGDVESVDVDVLVRLLDVGLMPVVSPLSADDNGTVLNINADTVAAELAAALRAVKLIIVTGAPGILERADDPSSLASYLDLSSLRAMRDRGALAEGMLPKAAAIEIAIAEGVPRVHVIGQHTPDGLLVEVFTNAGCGTLIVADKAALTPAEQVGTS